MSRPLSRLLYVFILISAASAFSPQIEARTTSASTTDADGNTTTITKNADGTTTRTVTDSNGQTVSSGPVEPQPVTKVPPRQPGTSASTKNADGNTVTITKNPDGTTTRTITSPDGQVLQQGPLEPEPVTKTAPRTSGTSASTTNADGTTTTITKNPDGTTTRTVTDANGQVVSSAPVKPEPVTKTPPRKGGSSASTTDADGNTVTIEMRSDGTRVRTVITLDGKLLKREPLTGPTTNAQLLYDSVTKDDVTVNTAMVLKKEGDKVLLEVSALSTGKGTQFRTWVTDKMILLLGKDRLKSSTMVPYYLEKESVVGNLAPALFAIIGAQYAADAHKAEAAKGTACSQSGESEAHEHERGKVARAIDQAGMAGGMTLLAKQAKGQMEGRKATFDVTTELSRLGNAVVLLRIVNTDTSRINVANAPGEI